MKYTLLLLPLLTLSAHASDECASVWVYTAYKTCESPANGLDLSKTGEVSATITQKSDWLSGGKNQQKVCSDVAADFNKSNLSKGLHAEPAQPTPTGEKSEDRLVIQQYQYSCDLTVKKYPFKTEASAACGVEDKISYQVGGSPKNLPGTGVTCLSCDNLSGAKPSEMVTCLRKNIETIVEPKAIELRDSDLKAVSAQAQRLLKLGQQVPIENLKSMDQLSFFTDFIAKHPVQNDSGGGGGGRGDKPTLQ